VIYATKNSNKFQKARFRKEKSVEDVVTLGSMAQRPLVYIKSTLIGKEDLWKLKYLSMQKYNLQKIL
jgi:hypothetical protein